MSQEGTLPPRGTVGHQCPAPREQCCHIQALPTLSEKRQWGPPPCISPEAGWSPRGQPAGPQAQICHPVLRCAHSGFLLRVGKQLLSPSSAPTLTLPWAQCQSPWEEGTTSESQGLGSLRQAGLCLSLPPAQSAEVRQVAGWLGFVAGVCTGPSPGCNSSGGGGVCSLVTASSAGPHVQTYVHIYQ